MSTSLSENRPVIISLAIAGVLLAGYMIYFFSQSSSSDGLTTENLEISVSDLNPKATEAEQSNEPIVDTSADSPETSVVETSPPSFILPRLNDSDQLIRESVVSITRHEGINAWLSPDELTRKAVVFIDNVASGRIVKQTVAVMAPLEEFKVKQISEKVFIVEDYSRYDTVTNVVTSIEARRLAELYVLLKPLFKEAYGELGNPNANFDDTIFRAIGRLLETPVLTEPPRLVRPVVLYEYEEERLENLSAAQKQLLRMGPKNTQAIQNKLSEIAIELRSVLGR
ncbi:MAG: hypothetical protein ACI9FB_000094 [Candidatus Azotimanducaceae bacterium]|jgi:hypothetical protein